MPVVSPVLNASGTLTFDNAAVQSAVATAPRQYRAAWFTFDNVTGASTAIGTSDAPAPRLASPAALPSAPGAYIRIDVSADHPDHPRWAAPVHTYFRRTAAGWVLVGLERMPKQASSGTEGP